MPKVQWNAEDTVYDNWHHVIIDVLGPKDFIRTQCWNFRHCDGQEKPQGRRSRQRRRDVASKMIKAGRKIDIVVVDTLEWTSTGTLTIAAVGVSKRADLVRHLAVALGISRRVTVFGAICACRCSALVVSNALSNFIGLLVSSSDVKKKWD